jgi:hypothetical protein
MKTSDRIAYYGFNQYGLSYEPHKLIWVTDFPWMIKNAQCIRCSCMAECWSLAVYSNGLTDMNLAIEYCKDAYNSLEYSPNAEVEGGYWIEAKGLYLNMYYRNKLYELKAKEIKQNNR